MADSSMDIGEETPGGWGDDDLGMDDGDDDDFKDADEGGEGEGEGGQEEIQELSVEECIERRSQF